MVTMIAHKLAYTIISPRSLEFAMMNSRQFCCGPTNMCSLRGETKITFLTLWLEKRFFRSAGCGRASGFYVMAGTLILTAISNTVLCIYRLIFMQELTPTSKISRSTLYLSTPECKTTAVKSK